MYYYRICKIIHANNIWPDLFMPTMWYVNDIELCLWQVDGPLYWITMATCVLDRDKWMENRLTLFKRLLVLTHARNVMPSGATRWVYYSPIKTVWEKIFLKWTCVTRNIIVDKYPFYRIWCHLVTFFYEKYCFTKHLETVRSPILFMAPFHYIFNIIMRLIDFQWICYRYLSRASLCCSGDLCLDNILLILKYDERLEMSNFQQIHS